MNLADHGEFVNNLVTVYLHGRRHLPPFSLEGVVDLDRGVGALVTSPCSTELTLKKRNLLVE